MVDLNIRSMNFDFLKKFASIENIWKKCYLMVDLSKFTFNKKILNRVVTMVDNQVCNQTLSKSF